MVQAELSVITYTPNVHSMAHWAIYLRVVDGSQTQHIIYQANGDEGDLELKSRKQTQRHRAVSASK